MYLNMGRAMAITACLLLAACGSGDDGAPAANTATGFVPPAVQAPAPLPGQAQSNPLSAYVGRYPGDPVDGVGFFDRTEVANALIAAVPDPGFRRTITNREATATPIFASNGRIGAHGCEPHNCSDNNWTFLVRANGTGGLACHHQAADGANSRWYAGSNKPVVRPGDCPVG
ncbi:MAG TPA: hypothetical protein VM900_00195 [Sphingomonas sp.]|jgi:hypothetical protein|nr:hypothetical protein [Sphingomonas sp.]